MTAPDIECPRCARRNPTDARFCNGCGRSLPRVCAGCGATIPAEAYRCAACGHVAPPSGRGRTHDAHVAAPLRSSPIPLDGERKRVTVLFADLKGSMELLAGRDPEAASAILETVTALMMDAVHSYEGTVNQVMGDGIMALFGAPLAFEDHAVRACHAALAMTAALRERAGDVTAGASVQARIGVNSGEVVVRTIGSDLHMEYVALGETTHLAARMQQLAEPGTILLTRETYRLVEGYVDARPVGHLNVKGLQHPVEAFELLAAAAVRTRWQARAVRGLTPFVGRHEELSRLIDALHRAEAGPGQVVDVVGEPGVGKSRLVWEFAQSDPARRCTVRETGCISYGVATPYFPIVELLRGYFPLSAGGGDAASARDTVVATLQALDAPLIPFADAFLALLEVGPEDPAWRARDALARRHRIHQAVIQLLIQESRARSLILVVEDLQWADSETRALLDGLVDALPTGRLLFIATYRAEHGHRWSNLRSYRRLALSPLPPRHADELLGKLLGEATELTPLRQLLVHRTSGNPFFIEETVRTLSETGAMVGAPGAFNLARGGLGTIHVPATVYDVLASRIDRLSAREKQLLQTAAVIGHDVPLRLLRALAERSDEELQTDVGKLEAGEFLQDKQTLPDREYAFKHALIRDVAYEGLLHELRRAIHARIVPAIEGEWPDRVSEYVDRLADHAHRGEVWDVALHYSRQAGAKAAARSAHSEAVAWFIRALDALAHVSVDTTLEQQAVDLHLSAANSLLPARNLVAMGEHLREAERQASAIGDRQRLARVSSFQSTYSWLRGRHDEAVRYGHQALNLAVEFEDFGLAVNTNLVLGEAHHALGQYPEAIEVLGRNVAVLRDDLETRRVGLVGLPAVLSRVWIVWSLSELGDFESAGPIGAEAVRIAERADHPYSRIIAYFGTGGLHLRRGELPSAMAILERAYALCRVWDTQLRQLFLGVVPSLGHTYALAGRLADAIGLLEESVQEAAGAGMLYAQPLRIAWLADAYRRAGRLADARARAFQALELARGQGERGHEAWALGVVADITAEDDSADVKDADSAYQDAIAVANELGMRPRVAVGHLGLGRLHRRRGRRAEAAAHLTVAINLFRSMEMPFWLGQAEAEENVG